MLAPSQKLTRLVLTLVPPLFARFAQCTMAIPGWTMAERGTFAKCITVLIQLSPGGAGTYTHTHHAKIFNFVARLLDTFIFYHTQKPGGKEVFKRNVFPKF